MLRVIRPVLKRDLVITSQFNIIEQLTNKSADDTFALIDILRNIIIALDADDLIDDLIVPSKNNTNIELITDTLMFMLINTYGFNESIKELVVSREVLEKFSTSINQLSLLYAKNIATNFSQTNSNELTLGALLQYYQTIESTKSDKNYFSKELITYVISTTKYDKYMIKDYGEVGAIKNTLNIIKETVFQKTPHNAAFKLISLTINGLTNPDIVNFDNKSTLSECEINNISTLYSNGINLYLSKIIVAIMRVYDYIYTRNDVEAINELINIIINDNFTLSEKYDKSVKVLYVKYQLKITIKQFIEDIYYLPVYNEEIINNTSTYTLDELKQKVDELEKKYDQTMDNIIIMSLLQSDPQESIPKITEMNKAIENNMMNYMKLYPDLIEMLWNELNTSLMATLMVQILSFPESLGKYLIEAGTQILPASEPASEPEPAPEPPANNCQTIVADLQNSSCSFALNTSVKVINYGFCKIKDALNIQDNQLIKTVENYIMSKFQ